MGRGLTSFMPEQEESSEPKSPGSKLGMFAAVVVGLPLLYLLSVGPADLIFEKTNGFGGTVSVNTFRGFYGPVIWLYENTFMKHPIEMYVLLWNRT